MALGFSQGLLGGLRQYGQGGDIPADPRQRNVMQQYGVTNPLLQQFGQSLGALTGQDMRSEAAIQQETSSKAMNQATDPSKTSAELYQIAKGLMNANMIDQGTAVLRMAEAKKAKEDAANLRTGAAGQLKGMSSEQSGVPESLSNTVGSMVESGFIPPEKGLDIILKRQEEYSKTKGKMPESLVSSLQLVATSSKNTARKMEAQVRIEQLKDNPTDTNINAAINFVGEKEDVVDNEIDPLKDFAPEQLETTEGLDGAIISSLKAGKPSLANALRERQQQVIAKEQGVSANLVKETALVVEPNYVEYQKMSSAADQIKRVAALSGTSGSAASLERLVTSLFPNDVKAVQELERFRQSTNIPKRISNTISMWISGDLSDAVKEDYVSLAEAMEIYYNQQLTKTSMKIRGSGVQDAGRIADTLTSILKTSSEDWGVEFD